MSAMISVSIWLPGFWLLSACYCLDRHYVLKSLVTSEYDGIAISSASTTNSMYTCLLRATESIGSQASLSAVRQRDDWRGLGKFSLSATYPSIDLVIRSF